MTDSMNSLTPRSPWLLAIDPGEDGSAAFFKGTDLLRIVPFKFTPNWEAVLYQMCAVNMPEVCIIEHVHAFPGQGVTSVFNFGMAFGACQAPVKIAGIPIEYVQPQAWTQTLGLPPRREFTDKAKRRAARRKDQEFLARHLYPAELKDWKATKHGDVFASLLIGYAAQVEHLPVSERGVHPVGYAVTSR